MREWDAKIGAIQNDFFSFVRGAELQDAKEQWCVWICVGERETARASVWCESERERARVSVCERACENVYVSECVPVCEPVWGGRHNSQKVVYIVSLHSTYTRAQTFENLCKEKTQHTEAALIFFFARAKRNTEKLAFIKKAEQAKAEADKLAAAAGQ